MGCYFVKKQLHDHIYFHFLLVRNDNDNVDFVCNSWIFYVLFFLNLVGVNGN